LSSIGSVVVDANFGLVVCGRRFEPAFVEDEDEDEEEDEDEDEEEDEEEDEDKMTEPSR
jgi:hypothetical protein